MSWTDPVYQGYNRRVAELEANPNPFAHGIAWTGGPEFVPVHEARIPLLDQGFLKSDLTYDVPAVWDGRFFRLDDHLDRFDASLAKLRLTNPLGRQGLRDKLVEMVAHQRHPRCLCDDDRNARPALYPPDPARGLRQPLLSDGHALHVDHGSKGAQKLGGSAIIARNVRRTPAGAIDPTVKNLQWGDFTRGILEARDRGAHYPILTDGDGTLTEGSGFNIVLVKDGTLYTPRRGVLEGVTRKSVLAAADKLGIPWVIDDLPVESGL